MRGSNLQQGELLTLLASAAQTVTASTSGTAVFVGGERKRFIVLLDITASATEAGDTLDVYVDWSLDNVTWFNGGHFTQQAGNGAARKEVMVFDASNPGTATFVVTSDAAAAAVRPAVFGAYLRTRFTVVEANANANSSHTFSVVAYAL